MQYRLKNTKTGQIGWNFYATLQAAKASAKAHTASHGAKVIVIDESGNAIQRDHRYARKNDGMQRMVDSFNFARPATR